MHGDPAFPGLHCVHCELPWLEKVPLAQTVQKDDPAKAAFVSTTQSSQSSLLVEPVLLFFFPAAHLLQSSIFVAPIAVEYVPGGHSLQASTVVD